MTRQEGEYSGGEISIAEQLELLRQLQELNDIEDDTADFEVGASAIKANRLRSPDIRRRIQQPKDDLLEDERLMYRAGKPRVEPLRPQLPPATGLAGMIKEAVEQYGVGSALPIHPLVEEPREPVDTRRRQIASTPQSTTIFYRPRVAISHWVAGATLIGLVTFGGYAATRRAQAVHPPVVATSSSGRFHMEADGPYGCPIGELKPGQRVVETQPYGYGDPAKGEKGSHFPGWKWGGPDLGVDGDGDGEAEPKSTGGRPVLSMNDGVAHIFPNSWPGGNGVRVVGDKWTTQYWHLGNIEVSEGQIVTAGTEIGVIGSSGLATGPHLHIDLKPNDGGMIDPTNNLECDKPQVSAAAPTPPQESQPQMSPEEAGVQMLEFEIDDSLYPAIGKARMEEEIKEMLPAIAARMGAGLDKLPYKTTVRLINVRGCSGVAGLAGLGQKIGGNYFAQLQTCTEGVSWETTKGYEAHEISHLLTEAYYGADIHHKATTMLAEGIATWTAWPYWPRHSGDGFRTYIKEKGITFPLDHVYANGGEQDTMYDEWASLIQFVIEKYGREKFDALYRSDNTREDGSRSSYVLTDKACESVFGQGKTFAQLEQEWRAWINQ